MGIADFVGRIAPASLPAILADLGLRSVMIEGGSRVLASFLHAPPRSDGTPVVDSVVVTVAPMFIGEGVGVVPEVSRASQVEDHLLTVTGCRRWPPAAPLHSHRDHG